MGKQSGAPVKNSFLKTLSDRNLSLERIGERYEREAAE